MDEILKVVMSGGPLGIVAVILLWYNKQQDARLTKALNDLVAEKEARVADAKGFTTMALDIQRQVTAAVTTLSEASRQRKEP